MSVRNTNVQAFKERPIYELPGYDFGRLSEPVPKVFASTPRQSIVPQLLVDFFITMPDTFSMLTMDCAYTFPAVLLTLGPSNWYLLKDLYKNLAVDGEVRRWCVEMNGDVK